MWSSDWFCTICNIASGDQILRSPTKVAVGLGARRCIKYESSQIGRLKQLRKSISGAGWYPRIQVWDPPGANLAVIRSINIMDHTTSEPQAHSNPELFQRCEPGDWIQ